MYLLCKFVLDFSCAYIFRSLGSSFATSKKGSFNKSLVFWGSGFLLPEDTGSCVLIQEPLVNAVMGVIVLLKSLLDRLGYVGCSRHNSPETHTVSLRPTVDSSVEHRHQKLSVSG